MPIWEDIGRLLMSLIHNGEGHTQVFTTDGTNAVRKIFENIDSVIPAVTIYNNGAATIFFGYKGEVPTVPLLAGTSYTARWKNPKRSGMCVRDGGNSGVTVAVVS